MYFINIFHCSSKFHFVASLRFTKRTHTNKEYNGRQRLFTGERNYCVQKVTPTVPDVTE